MWFRSGAVLFTDRGFRLIDFPAALAEEKFLRSSIDATEFDVVRGGRLIVLTPQLIPGAASQAEALERQGVCADQGGPLTIRHALQASSEAQQNPEET